MEDEQIIAADLEAKLTSMGHEVVGAEALQIAEQIRPELVFMDIQLRGKMNGVEAASHIQQSTGAQIVFITAFAGTFLKNPATMQQPGICLSKPYSKSQLEVVFNTLQRKQS